jgi:hypothetical protein
MRSKRARRIEDLRLTVDCLPRHTREAMLAGIAANAIIAGAYTDRGGGVCPMLAAHRHGGRTSLLAFARAWDRFCGARRPRPATERELTILRTHLEASLMAEQDLPSDFAGAIAGHQSAARQRRAREAQAVGTAWMHEDAAPADSREPELV